MRSSYWMLAALVAAGLAASVAARPDPRAELAGHVLRDAEGDFDAVRADARLSGSAPLVGLEPLAKPAGKGKRGRP